jgi:hypothetical protein
MGRAGYLIYQFHPSTEIITNFILVWNVGADIPRDLVEVQNQRTPFNYNGFMKYKVYEHGNTQFNPLFLK